MSRTDELFKIKTCFEYPQYIVFSNGVSYTRCIVHTEIRTYTDVHTNTQTNTKSHTFKYINTQTDGQTHNLYADTHTHTYTDTHTQTYINTEK